MARRRLEHDPDLLAVCRRRHSSPARSSSEASPEFRVVLLRDDRTVVDRFECREDELADRLQAMSCGRILGVLPGAATLVRTVHVPPSGRLQVEAAIRLEAEARLLGSAPAHRTAVGIIGGDGPHPTGIAVAWPESLDGDLSSLEGPSGDFEVTRVPEIACLAWMAGEAPAGVLASLEGDARNRTLSVVIPTDSGPLYRSTRCQSDLATALRPLLVESLLADGVEPSGIEPAVERLLAGIDGSTIDDSLVVHADAESRLSGSIPQLVSESSGPHAAEDRVIAAALEVSRGPLAPLAGLRRREAIEDPGLLRSITNRLSDGRTAVAVVFAAILVLILAPLASSGLRLMIMRGKVEDLAALEARVEDAENRRDVYRELERQAWSVTKLLGDISNLMPEQIEAISVSLSHGEPMTFTGLAKRDSEASGADAVFEFNRRLRESGLFANAGPMPSIDPPDGRGYAEFKITAELADPLRPLRPAAADDYAVLSFSDRRFGPVDDDGYLIVDEELKQARIDAMLGRGLAFDRPLPTLKTDGDPDSVASANPADASASTEDAAERDPASSAGSSDTRASANPAESARSSRTGGDRTATARTSRDSGSAAPREDPRARGRSGGSRSSGTGGSSNEPGTRASQRTNVIDIPPPLSEEEIGVLSNAEAKDRLSKVARARSAPGLSEEDALRLSTEFALLMNRVRETRDQ